MDRRDFERLVLESFGITADYPFENDPLTAVFRHRSNKKWFAIIINVKKSRLGIRGEGTVDIVNVKCDPEILSSLWQEDGIYPAYHMNKAHWLTLALGGGASDENIKWLTGLSYKLTQKINKKANAESISKI